MSRGSTIEVKFTGDTKDLSRAANTAGTDVEGFGKKVSGFAIGAGAAVTTMAISAVPALIGVGKELYNLGASSAIGLQKSETVFGDHAGGVAKWADSVNESLGLSDEAVIGLAAGMGDLLVPLGMTREAAAQMSTETVGLAGALSAWSQGQYDAAQVSDILTKAYLGETDGLKALGISLSAAEVDQRALEIAQADGRSEVTAMDKALASQQLIMEKSSDAQKAWNDGTMDSVKDQNELSATIADTKESLAAGLLPIVQKVTAWIVNDFIPGVRSAVETFQVYWPQIQAAVQPVLEWIVVTVQDVITVVQSAWEQFGDRILTHAMNVWKFIREGIEAAITTIKGVIDLVLGILTGDWTRAWDGIKGIVEGVWAAIENVIRFALRSIGLLVDIAWENLKGLTRAAWDAVVSYVSGKINEIVGFVTGIPGRIASVVPYLWTGIMSGITTAKDWVRDRIDDVVSFATGLPGRMSGLFGGMWDGIKNAFRSALNWVIDKWNGLDFTLPKVSFLGQTVGGGTIGMPNIPRLAAGGLVRHRSGGILANIGEGRYDEAVIPLSPSILQALGSSTVIQNFPAGTRPADVVKAQRDWIRRNGPLEGFAA